MLIRLQNSFAAMDAMARAQERVANNLANANTVGYKRNRTFTTALNELHQDYILDSELSTRITQYEQAFRMQMSVPELTDFSDEPDYIKQMYGT